MVHCCIRFADNKILAHANIVAFPAAYPTHSSTIQINISLLKHASIYLLYSIAFMEYNRILGNNKYSNRYLNNKKTITLLYYSSLRKVP